MAASESLLLAIRALYDAAQDETLWAPALKALAAATHSQAATFWVLHRSPAPRLPTFEYVNFDPAFIADYLQHVAPLDPTVQYLVAHPEQPIVHDALVISEAEKDRHPYYDWHARSSDTRYRLVGQVRPAPHVQAGVALHRTKRAGRYRRADVDQFTVLFPHLERALSVGFRLGTLGTLQQCTAATLDRSPDAVYLLAQDGGVLFANRRARDLHDDQDGVTMADGLRFQDRAANHRLRTLIAELSCSDRITATGGGSLRAGRPSGKRPYVVLVAPASGEWHRMSMVRPVAYVVVIDPEYHATIPVAMLESALGLTTAEARLAARLAEGHDLRQAAAALGITYGTARERLSGIFQKTAVHRQGELIPLVLRAVGR